LNSVEWGEFKIGHLFDISTPKKRFDANKVTVFKVGKSPYIVRTGTCNGQKGFINEDERYLNEGNTISFGQDTATMFYQEIPYFTGDKIKVFKPKYERFCKKNAQFFIAAMIKAFSSFSWGASSFSVDIIRNQMLNLPITKNNVIDFDFIDSFIAELEAERIAELEAYLTAAGLKDYELTPQEQRALDEFEGHKFLCGQFKFKDVFDKVAQGRRLKKDDQIHGDIPFVMSGITNTGVVNYIANPVAVFPKNSITVDIFGNAFYRGYNFGAGDDTGVYWSDKQDYSKEVMLYFAASMNKSLKGKFDYGNKLRSSQSLNIKMHLPIKENELDRSLMTTLISAIQKLVIKDVVLFAERKITDHKQVVLS